MANKGEANKGRQSLRLADEDLISLAGDGDAGAFEGSTTDPTFMVSMRVVEAFKGELRKGALCL